VSDRALPPQFVQLYADIRKTRNKIAHLHAGNIKTEAGEILRKILTAHGHLYDKDTWMEFRRKYMFTEHKNSPYFEFNEDYTNDRLNLEFEALRWHLKPSILREFFGYDVKKRPLTCFTCMERRTRTCDRIWDFAQKQKAGGVKCVVCSHQYADAEYKELADIEEKEFEESRRKYGPGANRP